MEPRRFRCENCRAQRLRCLKQSEEDPQCLLCSHQNIDCIFVRKSSGRQKNSSRTPRSASKRSKSPINIAPAPSENYGLNKSNHGTPINGEETTADEGNSGEDELLDEETPATVASDPNYHGNSPTSNSPDSKPFNKKICLPSPSSLFPDTPQPLAINPALPPIRSQRLPPISSFLCNYNNSHSNIQPRFEDRQRADFILPPIKVINDFVKKENDFPTITLRREPEIGLREERTLFRT